MARSDCLVHQRLSYSWKVWPVIFIILSSACHPVYSLSPTATLLPTPTKSTLTGSTPTTLPAAPLRLATPSPTTIRPMATIVATASTQTSTLSHDGPWLVYRHEIQTDLLETFDEFAVLNQNGTGRALIKVSGCMILDGSSTPIKVPGCDFENPLLLEEDPSNRIVNFSGKIMLIQPHQFTGKLIYEEWPSLHTAFTGNTENGFLASVYPPTPDAIPELRIYELPSGKIRNQFPLVKCSDPIQGCYYDDADRWEIQWSPDGRYLAFPARWDGPSTDLYLYDTENGEIQPLMSGPDQVGQIWWSPDGQWIVMGESNSSYPDISSLWVVSVQGNEHRMLYSLEYPFPQGIVGWVDNKRLIVFDGINLFNALDLPADNLRLVDIGSGEIKTLFDGNFYNVGIDRANQTIAVYAAGYPPNYEYGTYLVSIADPRLRLVTSDQISSDQITGYWNEAAGRFVTDFPCVEDPEGFQTFDSNGTWQCVRVPVLPDLYPSPKGQWLVSLDNGIWLETEGKQAIQVSKNQAKQVIWCPDSSCFFFVANKTLFHFSMLDFAILTVDDQLKKNWIVYQWLD